MQTPNQLVDEHKIQIRPSIPQITNTSQTKPEELFQNETLRPILKLQHDLLLAHFIHHIERKKIQYAVLDSIQKQTLIHQVFKSDTAYKTELRGLIIGHFTTDELIIYTTMSSAINKRMLTMAEERLLSTCE